MWRMSKKPLLFVAILLLTNGVLIACTYLEYPDPPIEYLVSRTETVFFGRLISKKHRTVRDDGEIYRVNTLTFDVKEVFKGQGSRRQSISYSERLSNRTSCDDIPPKSKVGEDWVIFIYYDEETTVHRFVRSSSDLSWSFDQNDKNDRIRLDQIRIAAASPKSTFFGSVQKAMFGRFSGSGLVQKVELRSANGSELLRSSTADDNHFRFDDIAAGTYTLRIFTSKEQTFQLPKIKHAQQLTPDGGYFADFKIAMDGKRPQYENFVLNWN